MMPEASHVYSIAKHCNEFDPRRGRTYCRIPDLYKHTNPPGMSRRLSMIPRLVCFCPNFPSFERSGNSLSP